MKTQTFKKQLRDRLKKYVTNPKKNLSFTDALPDRDEGIYIVITLKPIDLGDLERDVIQVLIDIWGSKSNTAEVDDIIDSIDAEFCFLNEPGDGIYPTYYREMAQEIEDTDKSIYRKQIKLNAYMYAD